jgi:hypothetical protein
MTRSKHTAGWAISSLVVAWCVGGCSDPGDSFSNDGQAGAADRGETGGDAGAGASGTDRTGGSADGANVTSGGTGGTGTGAAGGSVVVKDESGGSSSVGGQASSSAGGSDTGGIEDCGTHAKLGTRLSVSRLGWSNSGALYDAAAVVERSTSGELILACDVGVAGAGGADTSSPEPKRLQVYSELELPVFPVGAQVWVSSEGQPGNDLMYGQRAWALSVRDPGGILLFGALFKATLSVAAPVQVGTVTPYCTAAYQDDCYLSGTTVEYNQVELSGDTAAVVNDSETGTVTLDGIPYDVYVTSRDYGGSLDTFCMDYWLERGVALDIRARDLASRASELPIGAVPRYIAGNDPAPPLGFSFTGVDETVAFDVMVSYVGRDAGLFFP